MFLQGTEDLRGMEWSRQYLWDVGFIDGNFPLRFFPATDVEVTEASVNSQELAIYLSTYKFPKSSSVLDIKVTFIDDEKHSVFNWVKEWMKSLVPNGEYVLTLEDSVRTMQVIKLDKDRKTVIESNSYSVYPEGELSYTGSTEPGVNRYTQNFVIAGEIGGDSS